MLRNSCSTATFMFLKWVLKDDQTQEAQRRTKAYCETKYKYLLRFPTTWTKMTHDLLACLVQTSKVDETQKRTVQTENDTIYQSICFKWDRIYCSCGKTILNLMLVLNKFWKIKSMEVIGGLISKRTLNKKVLVGCGFWFVELKHKTNTQRVLYRAPSLFN